jgi:dipeptidyl aminopeptidase/acylaminoacyl peptidase
MRGPEIVGREPTDVRWSPDGQWIYFRWLPPGAPWRATPELFRVAARPGAVPEQLPRPAADSLAPILASGATSRDGRRRVVSIDGDLWLVELPGGAVRRLTSTPVGNEVDPFFDSTGNRIYFRRDRNLFAFDLSSPAVTQLSDLRAGPAPDTTRPGGKRGFVQREERELLRSVGDRVWRDSVDWADRTAREALRPKPIYLPADEAITAIVPSPAGTHALVYGTTPAKNRKTQVPDYVTTSGYTEPLESRIKVGDAQDRRRIGLLTFATGQIRWLRPIPGDSSGNFADLFDWGWNDAGTTALLIAETADNTSRHLVRIDTSGAVASLDVVKDSAWVGGPFRRSGGWLPGDRGLWFVSEADGFAHL